MTLVSMRGRSTTGTRSPIHRVPIIDGGCAQTLKLYGIMKYSAMPSPKTPWISSSKFANSVFPSFCAARTPSTHRRTASRGSSRTLFWKG
jgi:hypothetical protein